MIIVVVVAVLIVASVLAFAFLAPPPPSSGYGWFSDGVPTRVPPGSLGCADVGGEVCYVTVVGFGTGFYEVPCSDISFELTTNRSVSNGPGGSPVPLGPTAGVNVVVGLLNSSNVISCHWNWTTSSWSGGASSNLPAGIDISMILDSGQSASSLNSTWWWILLSSPGGGGWGFELYSSD